MNNGRCRVTVGQVPIDKEVPLYAANLWPTVVAGQLLQLHRPSGAYPATHGTEKFDDSLIIDPLTFWNSTHLASSVSALAGTQPPDILWAVWLCIAQFIPCNELLRLCGVDRTSFDIDMNECYRETRIYRQGDGQMEMSVAVRAWACMSVTHECSVSACERAAITCLRLFTVICIIPWTPKFLFLGVTWLTCPKKVFPTSWWPCQWL